MIYQETKRIFVICNLLPEVTWAAVDRKAHSDNSCRFDSRFIAMHDEFIFFPAFVFLPFYLIPTRRKTDVRDKMLPLISIGTFPL